MRDSALSAFDLEFGVMNMKTKYVVNLPVLPSEILRKCDLAWQEWGWFDFEENGELLQMTCSPTEPGKIDGICAVGAVLRAFGYELMNVSGRDDAWDSEVSDFMELFAGVVSPEQVREVDGRIEADRAEAMRMVVMRWSDGLVTSKADVMTALETVETELGYRV